MYLIKNANILNSVMKDLGEIDENIFYAPVGQVILDLQQNNSIKFRNEIKQLKSVEEKLNKLHNDMLDIMYSINDKMNEINEVDD